MVILYVSSVKVPPPPAEVNAIFALPSPASVTTTDTVSVFMKFNCLLLNVELLFAETRTVFAAVLAWSYAVFACVYALLALSYAELACSYAVLATEYASLA